VIVRALLRLLPCKDLAWWRVGIIRSVKTAAQTAVVMLPSAFTLKTLDWHNIISTAAFVALVSLLTSIAHLPEDS
jgi:hypothetical protein